MTGHPLRALPPPAGAQRLVMLLILALGLGAGTGWTRQEGAPPPSATITPAAGPITLDGSLDEPAWAAAWSTELPVEVSPGDNTPAPVRTVAYLTHDENFLYAGLRCFDPDPGAIRAHLTDRDDAWSDDWAGIVLDTFNDQRRNFLFVVNPYGIQMDTIETWDGSGGGNWDGIWDAASRIEPWGWSAELKIPFSSLAFQRSEGEQVWGFDAVRGYNRDKGRQMGAFPRDRNNNCYLCQAIKVRGFAGATPGRNLEITPTLTATATDTRPDFPDGPLEEDRREVEAGVTAKWGITPNLTLGGTINPDFSQVEADALQLDVNEPFALFYDEKRPFFMEGADFFATRLNAVYTRVMRDPAWGVKLTGKEGADTLGAYAVEDDTTNILLPGSQGSDGVTLEVESQDTVLRYKRDFGEAYTLGALFTDRAGDGYSNRLVGLDGSLRFTPRDWLAVQWLGSQTRYPDAVVQDYAQPEGTFEDWAGELYFRHSSRNFVWLAEYRDIGTDFRSDLGFMPRVDYRRLRGAVEYQWIGAPQDWYSNILVEAGGWAMDEQDGDLLEDDAYLLFTYIGPLDTHAAFQADRKRESYAGLTFEQDKFWIHNCMTPTDGLHFWINTYWGDIVDYVNARPAERSRFSGGVDQRLGKHLRLRLSGIYEEAEEEPGTLYAARTAELTAAWQFNARTFVRLTLQGVHYDYSVALYPEGWMPEVKRLFSQFLFSYKINPRTVFFLGYSDGRYGDRETDLTLSDRTVFAKVGYAWTP